MEEILYDDADEKDIQAILTEKKKSYHIYQEIDNFYFEKEEKESDKYSFSRSFKTLAKAKKYIKSEREEHDKDRFGRAYNTEKFLIVYVESHHDVVRQIVDKIVFEPVCEEPPEEEFKKENDKREKEWREEYPEPDFTSNDIDRSDVPALQELIGAKILDIGFHRQAREGGLVINYMPKGEGKMVDGVAVFPEEKRIVLGFTELGMWCEYNKDVIHGVNCNCSGSCFKG